jgi:hypothetical protein
MATLRVYGPFTWVRPFGQNAFMPGEEHSWFAGDFTDGSVVFQASAHPTRDASIQSLAVVSLRTTYGRSGGPVMDFVVRNVGTTAVFSYRVFVSGAAL